MNKNEGKIWISICLSSLLFVVSLIGCASTPKNPINPNEIIYQEISGKDYFSSSKSELYKTAAGYKISDIYIAGLVAEAQDGNKEMFMIFQTDEYSISKKLYTYATDYVKRMYKEQGVGWAERIDAVKNNEKYNGHYTIYVYRELVGNYITGYTDKFVLYDIEGIPSQEQLDADETERLAIIKAEKEKQEAEKKAKDEKGKLLAEGYIYHSIDETDKNERLFASGALESGHAYYISNFAPNRYSPSNMGSIMTLFTTSPVVYVKYATQKAKAEVMEASLLGGQYFPVSVVIAAGSGTSQTPVILGLVK